MTKKIGIIIQARMASTRLPNKIMLNLAGKPMLWHVIDRCKKANVDEVIVATSTNKENDIIEDFCKKNNVLFFRGSEDDVLDRYYQTAKKYELDTIIRVTSDCPLISPRVINEAIKKFEEENLDYVGNHGKRSFPRGFDVEIFNFATLEKTHNMAKEKSDIEHVTPFMFNNPKFFKISYIIAEGLLRRPDIRLTIDTREDLKLLGGIYNRFYSGELISVEEVLKFLDKNPELVKINLEAEKKQKKMEAESTKQEFIK